MIPPKTDLYTDAHLFVAAIRVLSHCNQSPPTLAQACRHLNISLERGGFIMRQLEKEEILEIVKQPQGDRLFVDAHLNIEKFKQKQAQSNLDKALSAFEAEKEAFSKKIESIQAAQAQKKKDLFAKLNNQLKAGPGQLKGQLRKGHPSDIADQ